ncbi:hypothetical protein BDV06DRAFT_209826 [Aspergillus oleicola]
MFHFNRDQAAREIEWGRRKLYYLEAWKYRGVNAVAPWNLRTGFIDEHELESWLNQTETFAPPMPPSEIGTPQGGIRLLSCNYTLFKKASVAPQKYEIGNHMLSLTHDLSTRWTTALLAGESIVTGALHVENIVPPPLASLSPCVVIRTYLMASPSLWNEPLTLGCIILTNHLRRLQKFCTDDLTPCVMKIEQQLGVTRVGRRNSEGLSRIKIGGKDTAGQPVERLRAEYLTVDINTELTRARFTSHNPKWNYEASNLLLKVAREISRAKEQYIEVDNELLSILEHNVTLARSIEDHVLGLQKRLELQLNVLYSFMAQTDNRLSARLAATAGRDSTSMKILAFITTIFLPGSFVATLFSMEMFTWEAAGSDGDGASVSPSFWIYWAVAAPLTAVTLCGWALWWSFEKNRYNEHLEGSVRSAGEVKTPPWWRRLLPRAEIGRPGLSDNGNVISIPEMNHVRQRHSHPVITETITATMKNVGMNIGATTAAESEFAQSQCDRFTSIDQLRFCNSGTEANLYASSVARQVTGRSKIIVFEGAYHGGLLSFAHGVPPNNNRDVAAAVLVEGMQDEVITSRLAPGGLQSSLSLSPDLTTLGKWIGGSLNIGAFGGRRDLMAVYGPRTSNVQHSGTFNSNTLAMNVGSKAMATLGDRLRTELQELFIGTKMAVTGVGAVMNIHFLPAGQKTRIRSVGDLNIEPQDVEAALRGIFWFYLIEQGIWIARRGMISLILSTTLDEIGSLKQIASDFIEEYCLLDSSTFLQTPNATASSMLSRTLLQLLSVASLAFGSPALQIPLDLQIQTTSGLVHGVWNNSEQTVRAFLGIPYAEAPIDELRFAPPLTKPPIPASAPIDASKFGAPCSQNFAINNESIWSILPYNPWNTGDISEDCLSVNVWAPASANSSIWQDRRESDGKKAVLLFVHGGGYVQGAGSVGFYDGSEIVKEHGDVLVVTFNYRLNVFGFPNAPGLELAIEWVHRNIAKVGGDPERILLFGQSVGSRSVDSHVYAYSGNPLISAIALLSGTTS